MRTHEYRAEGGFMIVELIMAAVLVALIAIGVFAAIVGSSRGQSNDRHRSVAASIAQQDQERMRAFKATDLSNYSSSRPVTIAGTTYTVASTGEWVSDSSGVLSCSSGSSTANYLKIATSVTWPSMGSLKPITSTSLVAPPSGSLGANRGSLVVKVTDQANVPLQGLSTAVGAPANLSDSTDSTGCAVFGSIPAGNYTLSFSQAGFVDVGGNNSFSKTTSVVASSTTTENLLYAQAGSITASFDTKVGSNPVQAAQAQSLTVAHNNLPAPGTRTWDPAGAGQNSIAATSLFPFTSGYGVYAGMCAANDPTLYNANYYTTNPGLVTVSPGGAHTVTVREPALNIRTRRNGTNFAGAHVVIKLTSAGCTETFPAQTSNAGFALPAPDYPFGTYQVCADAPQPTSPFTVRKVTVTGIANTNPAGTATTDINIPTSGTGNSGVCS